MFIGGQYILEPLPAYINQRPAVSLFGELFAIKTSLLSVRVHRASSG
jgi:hypothetical protein